MNENTDDFLLLISTDWFEPYLRLIFPGLLVEYYKIIKENSRFCVKEFMKDDDVFWNISFSAERIKNTRKCLVKVLNNVGIGEKDVKTLDVGAEENNSETIWLLRMITESLVQEDELYSKLELAKDDIEVVKKQYVDCERYDLYDILESECLSSDTNWDVYIKRITPDLPNHTYLIAKEYLLEVSSFFLFWKRLTVLLSSESISDVKSWYSVNIQSIADENFLPTYPSWY